MSTEYVLLDFETTGLDPEASEIIEIGAIRVRDFTEVERYQTFVKPDEPIPNFITQITGICDDDVADAPHLGEVVDEFVKFLGDSPIVAHNSSTEEGFLDEHVLPLAEDWGYQIVNSIEPIAIALPQLSSHSMDSLRVWGDVKTQGAHRAIYDCEDLLIILQKLHSQISKNRPELPELVERMFGPNHESEWWWSWFFNYPVQLVEKKSETLGDLRALKAADLDRDPSWDVLPSKEEVHTVFADAAKAANLEYRDEQERMAQEVRSSIKEGTRVAIEAPTGTGKSIAYLIPGILTAKSTKTPLVVSTHSKSLQDQLLNKDIPIARSILKDDSITATAVKGQENYLCLRKLDDTTNSLAPNATFEEKWSLLMLWSLAQTSDTVELDQVTRYLKIQFPPLGPMIDRVKSHHTTTVGPTCRFYKQCHFFNSARKAHQSNVIIANHALAFQWPGHLPQIRNVIFDEAHHLENQITQANSIHLREAEMMDVIERFEFKRGGRKRNGDVGIVSALLEVAGAENPSKSLKALIKEAKTVAKELGDVLGSHFSRSKSRMEIAYTMGAEGEEFVVEAFERQRSLFKSLGDELLAGVKLAEKLETKNDVAMDLLNFYADRFVDFEARIVALLETENHNNLRQIYWQPRDKSWRIAIEPIDVSDLSEPFFAGKRSVVLTSATLSTGSSPHFVIDRIGLKPSKPLVSLPSTYDLAHQAQAWIPHDIDNPGTPGHLEALIDFTENVVKELKGRTLLLMTSNMRLRAAATELRERLEEAGISVFDSVSDRRAAEGFKATENALLIGSERYGEGLDLPGKQLSCVIIEKINEAMTRSPLAQARSARTSFGLYEYDFPLRMMWLKQRAGRLIRSAADQGIVVIFDPRFKRWGRGSQAHVLKALAPIPVNQTTRSELVDQLGSLVES